jgi:hypothetical protein
VVLFKEAYLLFKPGWVCDIVRVHADKIKTTTAVKALVQAGAESFSRTIRPDDDSRIVKGPRNLEAAIRRSIVAKQKLEISVRLIENRSDGNRYRMLVIEKGHGDCAVRLAFDLHKLHMV